MMADELYRPKDSQAYAARRRGLGDGSRGPHAIPLLASLILPLVAKSKTLQLFLSASVWCTWAILCEPDRSS